MVAPAGYGDPRLPDRFWIKVYPCPITGCWLWGGAPRNDKGYGGFQVQRKPVRITLPAHKVTWLALVGPVPTGLVLDHMCRVTACVWPGHLRVVTHAVNIAAKFRLTPPGPEVLVSAGEAMHYQFVQPVEAPVETAESGIWRPVPGFEGNYEVSSTGRVRGIARVIRYGNDMRSVPACELAQSTDPENRRRVTLGRRGGNRLVHQLVLEAFIGPRPIGLMGCHDNGINDDNRVENLRWGTQSSNMRDRVHHGTDPHVNRTHCPYNHLLVKPNLTLSQAVRGHRSCLACSRGRNIVAYYKVRGVQRNLQLESDRYYAEIMQSEMLTCPTVGARSSR